MPEQVLGWFPLGLGLVVEGEPSELPCTCMYSTCNICPRQPTAPWQPPIVVIHNAPMDEKEREREREREPVHSTQHICVIVVAIVCSGFAQK